MLIIKRNGTAEETAREHLQDSKLIQLYQGTGGISKKRLYTLPVCPKCERLGLRDKGWALHRTMCCPHCGYRGVATHQASAYIQEKLYR